MNQIIFTFLTNANVKIGSPPSQSSDDLSNIAHPINIVEPAFTDLQDPPFDGQPSKPSEASMPVDRNDAEMHSGTTGGRLPLATISKYLPDSMEENDDLDSKGRIAKDSAVGAALDERQPLSSPVSEAQEGSPNESHAFEASVKLASSGPISPTRLASTKALPWSSQTLDSLPEDLVPHISPSGVNQNPGILTPSNQVPAQIGVRTAESGSQEDNESEYEDDDHESYGTEVDSEFSWAYARLEGGTLKGQDIVRLILQRTRDDLMEAFMEQFWMIINQRMSGNIRVHADSSSTSSASMSDCRTPAGTSSNLSSRKRAREDEGEGLPDEDGERRPKKPRLPLTSTGSFEESAPFACPYRKHNPRKYNFRDWPTCALTPQRTVARVKYVLPAYHLKLKASRLTLSKGGISTDIIESTNVDGVRSFLNLRKTLILTKLLFKGVTSGYRIQFSRSKALPTG